MCRRCHRGWRGLWDSDGLTSHASEKLTPKVPTACRVEGRLGQAPSWASHTPILSDPGRSLDCFVLGQESWGWRALISGQGPPGETVTEGGEARRNPGVTRQGGHQLTLTRGRGPSGLGRGQTPSAPHGGVSAGKRRQRAQRAPHAPHDRRPRSRRPPSVRRPEVAVGQHLQNTPLGCPFKAPLPWQRGHDRSLPSCTSGGCTLGL